MSKLDVGKKIKVVVPHEGDGPPSWLIGLAGVVKHGPYSVREMNSLHAEELRTYYQVAFEKADLPEGSQTSYTLREGWLRGA